MRQINKISKAVVLILLTGLWLFPACQSGYQIIGVEGSRIEMTSAYDKSPEREAIDLLAPYKAKVDSIMTPIIGKSDTSMEPGRPESLLSNLIADVLKESSFKHTGKTAEIAIINIGGLRNNLPKGSITYNEIYKILPFENSLCVLTLEGKSLIRLFNQIAEVGGEGLSGAKLKISSDRKLIEALVNEENIDKNRLYVVATVDYLSEGNDRMTAFLEAKEKICLDEITLHQIFLDYVLELTRKGKSLTSNLDGRISIEK